MPASSRVAAPAARRSDSGVSGTGADAGEHEDRGGQAGAGQAADLVGGAGDAERGRGGRQEGAQLLGQVLGAQDDGRVVLLGDGDHQGVDGEAGRVL